jgi:hypothetical protein
MGILIESRYKHRRTKDIYTVTSLTPIKINKIWTNGIVYRGHDGRTWCRTSDNFTEKFIKVKDELTDDEIIKMLIGRDTLKHDAPKGKRKGSTKSGKAMKRYYLFRKAYKKDKISLNEVAKMFNLRDHSSVIYGLKQCSILADQKYKPFMEIKSEYDTIFKLRRLHNLGNLIK